MQAGKRVNLTSAIRIFHVAFYAISTEFILIRSKGNSMLKEPGVFSDERPSDWRPKLAAGLTGACST